MRNPYESSLDYKNDKLVAPDSVIKNISSAYSIYENMRKSHIRRVINFTKIQGLIDGNPPYNKMMLKKKGLETQSNVNWRDSESVFESIALAYWSLFNDVKNVVTFTTTIASPESNPMISDIVSEEFDKAIKSWSKFRSVMDEHQADLIKFGSNTILWKDERDWRFDTGDAFRVLYPEKSRNDTSELSVCAIEHVMTAQQLFEIYENDETGLWDKDAIEQLLEFKANTNDRYLYSKQSGADIIRKIRNGDSNIEELYNDDIMLVTMFFREWDDTVTRVILPVDMQGSAENFLYKSNYQYSDFSEALQIFTFTPGERYIHGNKGVGHKMYNVMEGLSQIDNSLMDSVRRASTVLVRTKAGRGKDARQVKFVHGGFVDIGEAEVVQNLMGANLASNVEVANYFRQKLENNNNISGTNMKERDMRPQTFGEMRIQATKEAKVQKNRIVHYYEQLDRLFREVIKKMLKSKKGYPGYEIVDIWKRRCIAKGVPPEFFKLTKENEGLNGLPEHMEVRATRASGSGSQVADQIEMQVMMTILPTLGERGRLAVLRDFVAANRGFEYVDRYMPPEDQTQQPTSEDTLSSIENNQLEKGELVIVSPDNNHVVHITRHLNRLKQIAELFNNASTQAAQNGSENPYLDADQFGIYGLEEVDKAFQTIGPHLTRHIIFVQRDPTRQAFVKQVLPEWNVLANFGDKIAKNAQDHRMAVLREKKKEQERLQQEMPSEERIAMAEIAMEERVKMAKLQSDIAVNTGRDQLKFLLDRQKISLSSEVDRAKALNDIANNTMKTVSDIELTKAKKKGELV